MSEEKIVSELQKLADETDNPEFLEQVDAKSTVSWSC
jgi:hypothetical protein